MTDQNQTWKTRKQQARKLITQKSKAVTYKPETTLNMAGYQVETDNYIIHFMERKGRITYLGETTPEGEFN